MMLVTNGLLVTKSCVNNRFCVWPSDACLLWPNAVWWTLFVTFGCPLWQNTVWLNFLLWPSDAPSDQRCCSCTWHHDCCPAAQDLWLSPGISLQRSDIVITPLSRQQAKVGYCYASFPPTGEGQVLLCFFPANRQRLAIVIVTLLSCQQAKVRYCYYASFLPTGRGRVLLLLLLSCQQAKVRYCYYASFLPTGKGRVLLLQTIEPVCPKLGMPLFHCQTGLWIVLPARSRS